MSSRLMFPLECCQGTLEERRPPPFSSQCCPLASAQALRGQPLLLWRHFSLPIPPAASHLWGLDGLARPQRSKCASLSKAPFPYGASSLWCWPFLSNTQCDMTEERPHPPGFLTNSLQVWTQHTLGGLFIGSAVTGRNWASSAPGSQPAGDCSPAPCTAPRPWTEEAAESVFCTPVYPVPKVSTELVATGPATCVTCRAGCGAPG